MSWKKCQENIQGNIPGNFYQGRDTPFLFSSSSSSKYSKYGKDVVRARAELLWDLLRICGIFGVGKCFCEGADRLIEKEKSPSEISGGFLGISFLDISGFE